ncbi:hypothetical protein [Francisella salina]|uniref:Uncharacterized protein n=1 Tax=Francisella salina TaxID=573569 RepID=A0ABM5M8Z8_FRAST|nr:hypothetical protein [Francisella salina]AEI35668.1 hypothetical protein F7308_0741 [Francisella salina]
MAVISKYPAITLSSEFAELAVAGVEVLAKAIADDAISILVIIVFLSL